MASPSPGPASRSITARAASCSSASRDAYASSARRPTAPRTPPVAAYAASVSRQVLTRPPELEQGGRQERQRARLVDDLADEGVDERGFDREAGAPRRTFDRATVAPSRVMGPTSTWLDPVELGEPRIARAATVVIGAQAEHDDRDAPRIVGRLDDGAHEGVALFLVPQWVKTSSN